MKQDFDSNDKQQNGSEQEPRFMIPEEDLNRPSSRQTFFWVVVIVILAAVVFSAIYFGRRKRTAPGAGIDSTEVVKTQPEREPLVEVPYQEQVPRTQPAQQQPSTQPQTSEPPVEEPVEETPPPIYSDPAMVISSFRRDGVPVFGDPGTPIPDRYRRDVSNVSDAIGGYNVQLNRLYQQSAAVQQASGSLDVRLYINYNGTVGAVEVIPNGNFPQRFIQDVKSTAMRWRFNVDKRMIYKFTKRLYHGQ